MISLLQLEEPLYQHIALHFILFASVHAYLFPPVVSHCALPQLDHLAPSPSKTGPCYALILMDMDH